MQKSEQFIVRSGRLKTKIVPNFLWRPHCRKAYFLSEDDRGIFAIMLKGDMWSGDYFSMDSGRCKCYGVMDLMASTLYVIT